MLPQVTDDLVVFRKYKRHLFWVFRGLFCSVYSWPNTSNTKLGGGGWHGDPPSHPPSSCHHHHQQMAPCRWHWEGHRGGNRQTCELDTELDLEQTSPDSLCSKVILYVSLFSLFSWINVNYSSLIAVLYIRPRRWSLVTLPFLQGL